MRRTESVFASPFDLEERRRVKDRFGGDIVYFFNDAAYQESRASRPGPAIHSGDPGRRIATQTHSGRRHAGIESKRVNSHGILYVIIVSSVVDGFGPTRNIVRYRQFSVYNGSS